MREHLKDSFINQYSLSKTLKFRLIPEGKTVENIKSITLPEDIKRSENYEELKKIIDSYHIYHIENSLNDFKLEKLNEYIEIFQKVTKEDRDKKSILILENSLRKQIASAIYDKELFSKKILGKVLEVCDDEKERKVIESFNQFSSYLTGFNENRKNIYTAEEKSTSVAYRIVNQNLPKFLDNINVYKKVKDIESVLNFDTSNFKVAHGLKLDDIFTNDYFNFVLNQSGIDAFNELIGGYTLENGHKVQGLNELINLHCQKNKVKLPHFKNLYKQILSDRSTSSYIIDKFDDSKSVFLAINNFYTDNKSVFENIAELLSNVNAYDIDKIYVANNVALTTVSKNIYDNWSTIKNAISDRYDLDNKVPTDNAKYEKYTEKREKELKNIESYSLLDIMTLVNDTDKKLLEYFKRASEETLCAINLSFNKINFNYPADKNLLADEVEISKIKEFLDQSKFIYDLVCLLKVSSKENNKDLSFYAKFDELVINLDELIPLYNKVRNYATQKPYSVDKIKLNFNNSTLLNGWDKNKETANLSVILRDENFYYLAIMNKKHNKSFENYKYIENGEFFEKMEYKLLPGVNKMLPKICLSKTGIEKFNPSSEILINYENETHKKGEKFNLAHCHSLINYFKDCLSKVDDYKVFNFKFSDTKDYPDISYFYREVEAQSYNISFKKISKSYINDLVENGKLYLFKLYNKDFSPNSKGTPNLHTMYFKALFDEINLKNPVYKLNGEAEIFFRPKSLSKTKPTHPKNMPIAKKNSNGESLFTYDLHKDKRFKEDQFFFHFPITLNFKAEGTTRLNDLMLEKLKEKGSSYIIGIDRGERHLIYVSLINPKGEIEKQISLNTIVSTYNEKDCPPVDYHEKLSKMELNRLEARKSWGNIQNIKELKEGYISQVVHKICQLVEEYDAIIVMEDLNSGFKNSRVHVEKSVYQKFEKMLIDKLNFYVNKNKEPDEAGGIYNAYQLTNKFESFRKMGRQNGIIFYVPAWNTSKIDPVTGFVDLLHPKYESVIKSKEFINSISDINYNDNMFEFYIDYNKFKGGSTSFKKEWCIYTNGERISTTRDKISGQWQSKTINIAEEFKKLFEKYNIDINSNIKEQILEQTSADFYKSFMYHLKMTLQMRNSITATEIDYLISPVKSKDGLFFDSRACDTKLPVDADANGAYHIAKKGKWIIDKLISVDTIQGFKHSITNKEWLEYAQEDNG